MTGEVCDAGRWLVERRVGLDRGEAEWLERLAEFDRLGLWELDGQLGCVSWLVWRTNMARSTAFEKLRVAHELSRRPVIAAAFRRGVLSYSAVRAVTRMDRPDPGVDQAIVDLAAGGAGIVDIERLVRSYQLYADQERPPAEDPRHVRDVRIRRGDDGTGTVMVTLRESEVEEFAAALQAFVDLAYRPGPVDESPAVDSGRRPVDESPAGDGGEAPLEQAGRPARLADAFMDMVGAALAAADEGRAAGDDRYLVHVVTSDRGGSYSYLDGRPVHPVDAAAMACDCSTVAHTVTAGGEPLDLGRKTREWNTAQRRAISVRDGGQCRFPGCQHRHYDIHHITAWEDQGPTDVANGCCQCRRHHRMIHSGYHVEGDPNRELHFYRPDGTHIGTTRPAIGSTLPRQPVLVH